MTLFKERIEGEEEKSLPSTPPSFQPDLCNKRQMMKRKAYKFNVFSDIRTLVRK